MRGVFVCLVGLLGAVGFGVGWQDGAGAAAVREEDPLSLLGRLVAGPAPKETVAGATAVDLDPKFGPEMALARELLADRDSEERDRLLLGFEQYNMLAEGSLREMQVADDLATAFAVYVIASVSVTRSEVVKVPVIVGVIRFVHTRLSVRDVAAIPMKDRVLLYAQLKFMSFQAYQPGRSQAERAEFREAIADEMKNLFGVEVAQIQFRETGIEFGR